MLDQCRTPEIPVSSPASQPKGVCAECGCPFQKSRPHQQFCTDAHKRAFQNRQNAEGRPVIALAKAWRAGRNLGKDASEDRETARQVLSELCSILDNFNAADKAAGRPNPLHYAKGLLRQGRYIDRQSMKPRPRTFGRK